MGSVPRASDDVELGFRRPRSLWFPSYCFGAIVGTLILVILAAVVLVTWDGQTGTTGDGIKALLHFPSNPEQNSENIALRDLQEIPESSPELPSTKHSVELYYEVLCPYSRDFLRLQFLPAVIKLSQYIDPVLIPYGKANTTRSQGTRPAFTCQHGEAECQGNMIHACAISLSPPHWLSYLGCMIEDNRKPGLIGQKCAKKLGLDWKPIQECWTGDQGPDLLAQMGDKTKSLSPRLVGVPTVVVDGSQEGQDQMREDFMDFLCRRVLDKERPAQCENR